MSEKGLGLCSFLCVFQREIAAHLRIFIGDHNHMAVPFNRLGKGTKKTHRQKLQRAFHREQLEVVLVSHYDSWGIN